MESHHGIKNAMKRRSYALAQETDVLRDNFCSIDRNQGSQRPPPKVKTITPTDRYISESLSNISETNLLPVNVSKAQTKTNRGISPSRIPKHKFNRELSQNSAGKHVQAESNDLNLKYNSLTGEDSPTLKNTNISPTPRSISTLNGRSRTSIQNKVYRSPDNMSKYEKNTRQNTNVKQAEQDKLPNFADIQKSLLKIASNKNYTRNEQPIQTDITIPSKENELLDDNYSNTGDTISRDKYHVKHKNSAISPTKNPTSNGKWYSLSRGTSPTSRKSRGISPSRIPTSNKKQDSSSRGTSPAPNKSRGVSPSRIPTSNSKRDALSRGTSPIPTKSRGVSPSRIPTSNSKRDALSRGTSPIPTKSRGVSPSRIPTSNSKRDSLSRGTSPILTKSRGVSPSRIPTSKDKRSRGTSPISTKSRGVSPSRIPSSKDKREALSRGTSPTPSRNCGVSPYKSPTSVSKPDSISRSTSHNPTKRRGISPSRIPLSRNSMSNSTTEISYETSKEKLSPTNLALCSEKNYKSQEKHGNCNIGMDIANSTRGISPSTIPTSNEKLQVKVQKELTIDKQLQAESILDNTEEIIEIRNTARKQYQSSPTGSVDRSSQTDVIMPYFETHFDTIAQPLKKEPDISYSHAIGNIEISHLEKLKSTVSSGSESSLGILDIPLDTPTTSLIDLVTSADDLIAGNSQISIESASNSSLIEMQQVLDSCEKRKILTNIRKRSISDLSSNSKDSNLSIYNSNCKTNENVISSFEDDHLSNIRTKSADLVEVTSGSDESTKSCNNSSISYSKSSNDLELFSYDRSPQYSNQESIDTNSTSPSTVSLSPFMFSNKIVDLDPPPAAAHNTVYDTPPSYTPPPPPHLADNRHLPIAVTAQPPTDQYISGSLLSEHSQSYLERDEATIQRDNYQLHRQIQDDSSANFAKYRTDSLYNNPQQQTVSRNNDDNQLNKNNLLEQRNLTSVRSTNSTVGINIEPIEKRTQVSQEESQLEIQEQEFNHKSKPSLYHIPSERNESKSIMPRTTPKIHPRQIFPPTESPSPIQCPQMQHHKDIYRKKDLFGCKQSENRSVNHIGEAVQVYEHSNNECGNLLQHEIQQPQQNNSNDRNSSCDYIEIHKHSSAANREYCDKYHEHTEDTTQTLDTATNSNDSVTSSRQGLNEFSISRASVELGLLSNALSTDHAEIAKELSDKHKRPALDNTYGSTINSKCEELFPTTTNEEIRKSVNHLNRSSLLKPSESENNLQLKRDGRTNILSRINDCDRSLASSDPNFGNICSGENETGNRFLNNNYPIENRNKQLTNRTLHKSRSIESDRREFLRSITESNSQQYPQENISTFGIVNAGYETEPANSELDQNCFDSSDRNINIYRPKSQDNKEGDLLLEQLKFIENNQCRDLGILNNFFISDPSLEYVLDNSKSANTDNKKISHLTNSSEIVNKTQISKNHANEADEQNQFPILNNDIDYEAQKYSYSNEINDKITNASNYRSTHDKCAVGNTNLHSDNALKHDTRDAGIHHQHVTTIQGQRSNSRSTRQTIKRNSSFESNSYSSDNSSISGGASGNINGSVEHSFAKGPSGGSRDFDLLNKSAQQRDHHLNKGLNDTKVLSSYTLDTSRQIDRAVCENESQIGVASFSKPIAQNINDRYSESKENVSLASVNGTQVLAIDIPTDKRSNSRINKLSEHTGKLRDFELSNTTTNICSTSDIHSRYKMETEANIEESDRAQTAINNGRTENVQSNINEIINDDRSIGLINQSFKMDDIAPRSAATHKNKTRNSYQKGGMSDVKSPSPTQSNQPSADYSIKSSSGEIPYHSETKVDLMQMRLNLLQNSSKPSDNNIAIQSNNINKMEQIDEKNTRQVQSKEIRTKFPTSNRDSDQSNMTTQKSRNSRIKSFFCRRKPDKLSAGPNDIPSPRQNNEDPEMTGPHVNSKTYHIRFYILALFSACAMWQCLVWGTWGSIMESAKYAFPSWTSGTISMYNSWGPIACIMFIIPMMWLNQRYGLRLAMLLATCLMLIGTAIRCIPSDEATFTLLANAGAIFNSLAGCLTLSLPANVAATWFPPSERTTATAVAGLFSQLGTAAIYLEPFIVRAPQGAGVEDCSSYSRNDRKSAYGQASRYTRSANTLSESSHFDVKIPLILQEPYFINFIDSKKLKRDFTPDENTQQLRVKKRSANQRFRTILPSHLRRNLSNDQDNPNNYYGSPKYGNGNSYDTRTNIMQRTVPNNNSLDGNSNNDTDQQGNNIDSTHSNNDDKLLGIYNLNNNKSNIDTQATTTPEPIKAYDKLGSRSLVSPEEERHSINNPSESQSDLIGLQNDEPVGHTEDDYMSRMRTAGYGDSSTSSSGDPSVEDVRGDIDILMYIHAGVAAFLFVLVVCYFPAAPKTPPSTSSAIQRMDYFQSLKAMITNSQLMLLVLTYVFSVGVPIVWIGVMNFSLCCLGIRQEESMYIAISAITLSCLTAFIAARVTDILYGHLKITCVALLLCSSVCFLWFLLLTLGVIPVTIAQVYMAIIGGVALQYATVPLLIELTVEIAYPCPEGVVGAFLTISFNVISGTFLLLFLIPSACYTWSTALLVACTSLTTIPLMLVKETHNRRADDEPTAGNNDKDNHGRPSLANPAFHTDDNTDGKSSERPGADRSSVDTATHV